MGLFGGCGVNGASVAACSKQMHSQLIQRQHVLKVVHQLKKVTLLYYYNNAAPCYMLFIVDAFTLMHYC